MSETKPFQTITYVDMGLRWSIMFWLTDHYMIRADEGDIMSLRNLTLPWRERARRAAKESALKAAMVR